MREVGEDGHIEDDAVDATLVECMTRDLDRDRSGALLDLGLAYRSSELAVEIWSGRRRPLTCQGPDHGRREAGIIEDGSEHRRHGGLAVGASHPCHHQGARRIANHMRCSDRRCPTSLTSIDPDDSRTSGRFERRHVSLDQQCRSSLIEGCLRMIMAVALRTDDAAEECAWVHQPTVDLDARDLNRSLALDQRCTRELTEEFIELHRLVPPAVATSLV